jgi:hypothetical protein
MTLSPRLSVTHNICLQFLSKQTRHGRNIVSFYFFLFVCDRNKCLSREQCVGCRRCLVLQLQSAEVSGTVTRSFKRIWTISVNVNEGIQDPEN